MLAFSHLNIYDARERRLVGVADLALEPLRWWRARRPPPTGSIRRILVLRLERIGDLLMALPALDRLRARCPHAAITLAVGGWNAALARALTGIDAIELVDLPWLARERAASSRALIGAARTWRGRFDLLVNFEPDIRTNLIAALTGTPRRVGFDTGGGGALLTASMAFDPRLHTADNLERLVTLVPADPPTSGTADADDIAARGPVALRVPQAARDRVRELVGDQWNGRTPLIVVHASGGRAIKQWPPDRFGAAAAAIAREYGALVVLTGTGADRALADDAARALPPAMPYIDLVDRLDLVELAGLIERSSLVMTGDTGPMHLATALRRPVVAVFGPSDPARYAPRHTPHRVVRIDLPCSPCNRIRLPPARCVGHTPDCLKQIDAAHVIAAARQLIGDVSPGGLARPAVDGSAPVDDRGPGT